MINDFLLADQCKGHTKAVRTCCVVSFTDTLGDFRIITGGLDSLIIVWKPVYKDNAETLTSAATNLKRDNDPYVLECERQIIVHEGFVYCCCAGRACVSSDKKSSSFFTGGKDKKACHITLDGDVIQTFTGHDGPINSICLLKDSSIITGSWDATARVWDILTGNTLYVLDGHSHAVCVCALDDVVLTASQDKTIRTWKDGILVNKLTECHTDIIRSFAKLPNGFLSCSNDGDIKSWSNDVMLITTLHGHSSFVFDVKALASYRNVAISSSDDCSVIIWDLNLSKVLLSLPHSATVWKVDELPNGDIISCCEDTILRIWTTVPEKALPESERKFQSQQAQKVLEESKSKAMEAVDLSNLPPISELPLATGKRVGETKMFTDGNLAIAFQWNGSSWERMGEVLGAESVRKSKPVYAGDQYFSAGEYDYIFDVEIGNNPEKLKLPFNKGQNVLLVAESFCARYNIPRGNIEQIVSFLRANADCSGCPNNDSTLPKREPNSSSTSSVPSTPSQLAGTGAPTTSGQIQKVPKHFPLMEVLVFKQVNWELIHKKILEFNSSFQEDNHLRLSTVELLHLNDAIERCKHPSWLKQEFRSCEKELIFKRLSDWPAEKAFPVMDLWKSLALHPDCACSSRGHLDGWLYCSVALKFLKADIDSLTQCCLRFLANMYWLSSNRSAVLRRREQILDQLSDHTQSTSKHIRIALATIIANFAVGFYEQSDPEGCLQIGSMLHGMMEDEKEEEAYYRCLVAVGTLSTHDCTSKELFRDLGLPDVLKRQVQQFASNEKIQQASAQLLIVLS